MIRLFVVITICSFIGIAQSQCIRVITHSKISDTRGLFTGGLSGSDNFGSPAYIGDLNGDGIGDLAVGAMGDDDGGTNRGAVWILFLDEYGRVKSEQKISSTTGGFGGTLSNGDNLGTDVVSLGDINNDGSVDIAVGCSGDDDGGTDRGAVYILFLKADGTVKNTQKISDLAGGFTDTLSNGDAFGSNLGILDDLNGDGKTDLLVGAPFDDDGGTDRGAVWVLNLDTNGTVLGQQKISDTKGNFTGVLDNGDEFSAPNQVGDLDGDNVIDIAVGARNDDDGGTDKGCVWILMMNSDGTVKSHQKLSSTSGSLTADLRNSDNFGSSVRSAFDLDSDGIREIIVGAENDDDGNTNRGAFWLVSLDQFGMSKNMNLKFSDTVGNFVGLLDNSDLFGGRLSYMSDFNGDGMRDIAVGARQDDDGSSNAGGVWILSMGSCSVGCVGGNQILFEKTFIGSSTEFGHSIIESGDGNFIICGTTETFSAGSTDIFVIKVNPEGDTIWTKTFGSSSEEIGHSLHIRAASDSGYILTGRTYGFGTTNGGVYIVKLQPNGDIAWDAVFDGSANEHGRAIELTEDKGYIIAGTNGLILKLDSAGNMQWNKFYSGGGNMHFTNVAVIKGKFQYLMLGEATSYGSGGRTNYTLLVDSLGNKLRERIYDFTYQDGVKRVLQTNDGGILFSGATRLQSSSSSQVGTLTKLDSAGNFIWARYYSTGNFPQTFVHAREANEGGFIFTGYSERHLNHRNFTMKVDEYGNLEWARAYQGSGNVGGNDTKWGDNIVPTSDDGYFFINHYTYSDTSLGLSQNLYLIKLNNCGETACNYLDLDIEYEEVEWVISDPNSSVTSTGTFSSVNSVDSFFNAADTFICEYDPLCQLYADFQTDTVCVGDTTTFMDLSTDSLANVTGWRWYYGDGDSTWNQQNAGHFYSDSGVYEAMLVVFNDDTVNCTDTSYKDVIVRHYPGQYLGPDSSYCFGDTVKLSGGPPEYTFLWSDASTDSTLWVDTSGTFWVSVMDGSCATLDSISLTFDFPPIVDLGPDSNLCYGDTIALYGGQSNRSYTWSDASTDTVLFVDTTGLYWVEVTQGSCTRSDSVDIIFNIPPNFDLGPDSLACESDSIVLTGDFQIYTHLWYDASTDSFLVADTSGKYWVYVENGACSASDSVVLTFEPAPVVELGNDTILCQGSSVLLDASVPSGSYLWNTNATTATLNVSQSGMYWVQVMRGPCLVEDSIEIVVEDSLDLSLGDDTVLCSGTVYQLTVQLNGSSIEWHDNSTSPVRNFSTAGTYWAEFTSPMGACQSSDTVEVNFDEMPVLDLGDDTVICTGDSVVLEPGIVNANYSWSTGSLQSRIAVYISDDYILTLDSGACTITDEIRIDVLGYPELALDSQYYLCRGTELVIELIKGYSRYQWSNGDTISSTLIENPNWYKVEVGNEPCLTIDSFRVRYHPALDTIDSLEYEICENPSVQLDALNPGARYLWSTGETTRIITVAQEGLYDVEITSRQGCEIGALFVVTRCENPLVIPNTITPNGDGKNDRWIIENLHLFPQNHVSIFNPNGHLLFSENGYKNKWDATHNGKDLPATVYFYVLDLGDGTETLEGTITVIRTE